jgi:hypothetical protein
VHKDIPFGEQGFPFDHFAEVRKEQLELKKSQAFENIVVLLRN